MAKKIPHVIYTNQFLRYVEHYAARFRANKGFGRWLAEYRRMDEEGLFEPENLKEQYIDILLGTYERGFIYKQAVYAICVYAVDDAIKYISSATYDIRVITGEIAVDDDGDELTDLSMVEALEICNAMNEEAEEILFRVHDSKTNETI